MGDGMPDFESAWGRYPDYRIELRPCLATVRVWHGDLLVAESAAGIRLEETKHVDRVYIPEGDVRLELFEPTDHHTICPFKGRADYWSLVAGGQEEENVIWTYRDTFEQVAGIKGYIGIYHERLRVDVEEQWPGTVERRDRVHNRFPIWGDAEFLTHLLDVQEAQPDRYVVPAYPEQLRNVVEGSQMLGQAVVAASKAVPGKTVTSGYMIFSKSATYDDPLDFDLDRLHQGRTMTSVSVQVNQTGTRRASGLLLLDAGAPDTLRSVEPMPDVPGPYDSEPLDMRVSGRDLRIVDGAYDPNPDRVGPPEINAWIRFRRSPAERYLRQALVAQATGHWTLAAAMRPHPGFGEAQAHVTLSTGIMSIAIAFHDDAPVDEWLLYANPAIWAGHGLCQGVGRVYTEAGGLVASYTVQALLRGFETSPEAMGLDYTRVM
jgi:acyl-CoA thioesterase-2